MSWTAVTWKTEKRMEGCQDGCYSNKIRKCEMDWTSKGSPTVTDFVEHAFLLAPVVLSNLLLRKYVILLCEDNEGFTIAMLSFTSWICILFRMPGHILSNNPHSDIAAIHLCRSIDRLMRCSLIIFSNVLMSLHASYETWFPVQVSKSEIQSQALNYVLCLLINTLLN